MRARPGSGPGALALAVVAAGLLHAAAARPEPRLWPPWLREKRPEPEYPALTVTAAWLLAARDSARAVVLDARPAAAYRAARIRGAVSLPPDSLPVPGPGAAAGARTAAALAGRGLRPGDLLVCYADSATLPAAARLFWRLELAGARAVRLLDGGLTAWLDAGGVIEEGAPPGGSEPPAGPPAAAALPWEAASDTAALATPAWLAANFGRRGIEVLDARAAGLGGAMALLDDPRCVWRDGHVPHSLPFDFRTLLGPGGRWRPARELRAELAAVGPRSSTRVDIDAEFAVYDDGVSGEGALGYVALRLAAFPRVRYCPDGWAGWIAAPERPVVRLAEAAEVAALATPAALLPAAPSEGEAPVADIVLLDVRHDLDFYPGHLPGAVNLPAHQQADSLEVVLARHWPHADPAATPAVAYCYGPDCIRSRNAATALARLGFLQAVWFRGGIEAWRAAGLPLAQSPAKRAARGAGAAGGR